MLRRLAEGYLQHYYASKLNDNCTAAANFGYNGRHPGVWFHFGAHTCSPMAECPHDH